MAGPGRGADRRREEQPHPLPRPEPLPLDLEFSLNLAMLSCASVAWYSAGFPAALQVEQNTLVCEQDSDLSG